jgi:glucose dehydrogenase
VRSEGPFEREFKYRASRKHTWLALGVVFLIALAFWVRRKNRISGWAAGLVLLVSGSGVVFGVWERRAMTLEFERTSTVEYAMRGAFGEDHSPQWKAPYSLYRHPLLDPHGLPCAPAPWGTVAALNLQTGKMAWEQPHGTQVAGEETGSPSLGGLMVTAGGLVFSAGTREPVLRAYDSATGEVLWQGELPVPAIATPMTYEVGGRQLVVIAAGGSGLWGTKTGDAVIAFGVN